jgi:hypothetical protein
MVVCEKPRQRPGRNTLISRCKGTKFGHSMFGPPMSPQLSSPWSVKICLIGSLMSSSPVFTCICVVLQCHWRQQLLLLWQLWFSLQRRCSSVMEVPPPQLCSRYSMSSSLASADWQARRRSYFKKFAGLTLAVGWAPCCRRALLMHGSLMPQMLLHHIVFDC